MPYLINKPFSLMDIARCDFVPEIPDDYRRKFVMADDFLEGDVRFFPKSVKVTLNKENDFSAPGILGVPGRNVVSAKVKEIIESLEPEKHKFFQLKAEDQCGKDIGTYYFLFVTQDADAYIYDKTAFIEGYGLDAAIKSRFLLLDNEGIRHPCVLSKAKISGMHLWRGALKRGRTNFFALKSSGMKLFLQVFVDGILAKQMYAKPYKVAANKSVNYAPCRRRTQ